MIGPVLALVLVGTPALRAGTEREFIEGGFAVQGRLSWRAAADGAGEPVLELKRLRFSLRGAVEGGLLTFGVQLNTTPAALELLDLWFGWNPAPGVTLKAGQLKTPFTRHRAGSFVALSLVDWSLAAVHFGAERQLGGLLELSRAHGSVSFGVFTGTNARASFARGVAELSGVPLLNRSDFRVQAEPEPLHPELMARAGVSLPGAVLKSSAFFSAAWDLRPTWGLDFQLRLAPELELQWRSFTLELVGYAGWAPDRAGVLEAVSVGGTAELRWQLDDRWRLAGRWSRVEVLAPARPAASALLRQELAAGLSWRSPHGLGAQLEGAWLRGPVDEFRVRLQLQFAL